MTRHFPLTFALQRLPLIIEPTLLELPTVFTATDLDDNYGDFLKQHAAIREFYRRAIEGWRANGIEVDGSFLGLLDDAVCDCIKAPVEQHVRSMTDAVQ